MNSLRKILSDFLRDVSFDGVFCGFSAKRGGFDCLHHSFEICLTTKIFSVASQLYFCENCGRILLRNGKTTRFAHERRGGKFSRWRLIKLPCYTLRCGKHMQRLYPQKSQVQYASKPPPQTFSLALHDAVQQLHSLHKKRTMRCRTVSFQKDFDGAPRHKRFAGGNISTTRLYTAIPTQTNAIFNSKKDDDESRKNSNCKL